ncbi:MerR family transcriptional regulator [Bacillus sp. 03113]|uniref:MerR family transcriptional regulator n=1 Tax=Bacillus sp. 03113 TaxID=2578211 RepID=UPI0011428B67|nr:MerR family transcriptional regulator [Bacillus sp. 03113]
MRWYDGAVYRIGELANLANVSKRTIDYYTSLGLIKANRSEANYRIYSEDTLDDLRVIEDYKRMHLPLEEIKRKLEWKSINPVEKEVMDAQIESITQLMKQLHHELDVLSPFLNRLGEDHQLELSKKLSCEGSILIQLLERLNN